VEAAGTYRTPECDVEAVETLRNQLGVSRIVARLLVLRGIADVDAARDFLSPSLERDWCDPSVIPDLDRAAAELAAAVRDDRRIVVFGDFDVDGVTATAVMVRALRAFGATQVVPLIPRRLEEGYGLTPAAEARILAEEPELVVTVDNGISAAVEVADLVAHGVSVIVTDHHEPGDHVPQGVPVADPKCDPSCPSGILAGVGVALKLVQATGALLGFPDLWRSLIDIATLGTIGDQMPLVGENRALVAAGMERMRTQPSAAITAFCALNPRCMPLTSEGLSFSLLPRINSAGRMGDAMVALELLLAPDAETASARCAQLEQVNEERRAAEASCAKEALEQAAQAAPGSHVLVLASDSWHEGVKGIVASRVVSQTGLPAILFTITPDGLAHGSGRTVGTVNLFEAVSRCQDLLVRFGGHEAAVGVTLEADRIDAFRERLEGVLAEVPPERYVRQSEADMEVELGEVDLPLVTELSRLAPFGQGNRAPIFVVRAVVMEDRRRLGNPPAHLSCMVSDGAAQVRAIYFRPKDLDALAACDGLVDVVFAAEDNEFRGNHSVQMMVKDIVLLSGPSDDTDGPDGPQRSESIAEALFSDADRCLDRGDYAGITDAESFHTKVAGVSFEGRQETIAALQPPCDLELVREPGNAYDASAIAVMCAGRQIGYLNARLAARLAPAMDAGVLYAATLEEVTGREEPLSTEPSPAGMTMPEGGEAPARTLGVNIVVYRCDLVQESADHLLEVRETRERWSALPADELDDAVRRALIGDHPLHEAQATSLTALARGENTLTIMATGRGKSLIFHQHAVTSALRDRTVSIFIYPLRALVADQAFHLQKVFETFGLTVRVITGESDQETRTEVWEGISEGTVDCVLTTPEFLTLHADAFARSGRIGFLVVDEAHHVGASGANRSAYNTLGPTIHALGDPTVLAVTATAGDEAVERIGHDLSIRRLVLDETVRDNLHLVDERDVRDRNVRLAHLAASGRKTVVYVNSREQTVQLARMLRHMVPDGAGTVGFYNAGLSRADRSRVEAAFREGELLTVVSTSAFGEGVDIPDIRNVVLYHLPFSSVEFNQMAGRCGRDGREADVHLMYGRGDARINQKVLESGAPPRGEMVALYRVLRARQEREGAEAFWSCSNAELAEACAGVDAHCRIVDSGVSCGIQVFRELGLVESTGYGSARRLHLVPGASKVDLESSTRYLEGQGEIAAFDVFRTWALSAPAAELLARFNRPLMPSSIPAFAVE